MTFFDLLASEVFYHVCFKISTLFISMPELFMVEIRINATFLNCRRELRLRTAPKFCRDSEIAPTECERL